MLHAPKYMYRMSSLSGLFTHNFSYQGISTVNLLDSFFSPSHFITYYSRLFLKNIPKEKLHEYFRILIRFWNSFHTKLKFEICVMWGEVQKITTHSSFDFKKKRKILVFLIFGVCLEIFIFPTYYNHYHKSTILLF